MNKVKDSIKAIEITLKALEHDKDEWLKDLMIDIKLTLEEQEKEVAYWKGIVESNKYNK